MHLDGTGSHNFREQIEALEIPCLSFVEPCVEIPWEALDGDSLPSYLAAQNYRDPDSSILFTQKRS